MKIFSAACYVLAVILSLFTICLPEVTLDTKLLVSLIMAGIIAILTYIRSRDDD